MPAVHWPAVPHTGIVEVDTHRLLAWVLWMETAVLATTLPLATLRVGLTAGWAMV